LDRGINQNLHLLAFHLPYHESDHILTHVYNLFVGGRFIEDIASLQHSPAIKTLLGAVRIPDPTTAGDFLRRFGPQELKNTQVAIDEARVKVWAKMPRAMRESITLDMDSTFKEVYGECKQGAEFSYKGQWSYHPLLFTLSETGECLRLINRPGNRPSAEGAAEELGPCLDLLRDTFRRVYLRGDSKFGEKVILQQAIERGVRFAIVHEMTTDLQSETSGATRPNSPLSSLTGCAFRPTRSWVPCKRPARGRFACCRSLAGGVREFAAQGDSPHRSPMRTKRACGSRSSTSTAVESDLVGPLDDRLRFLRDMGSPLIDRRYGRGSCRDPLVCLDCAQPLLHDPLIYAACDPNVSVRPTHVVSTFIS
jgi:hypothetical protein